MKKIQKALIIGVYLKIGGEDSSSPESIEEVKELISTAGGETVGVIIQNRDYLDARTLIGSGKAAEIQEEAINVGADLAVFDHTLTDMQLNELAEVIKIPIIDRNTLILDIFALRSKTNEGKIQVELAQLQYNYSRLKGLGLTLSRQGGGIGTRGPGETQLETDRRYIKTRIDSLKDKLKDIEAMRAEQRKKRVENKIPIVSIVGYTNAGKSTLLNTLSGSDVYVEDKLFATLETTVRKISGEKIDFLLTDTVGFLSRLPHQLIAAFKSTLEEATYADLLLNVIDYTNPDYAAHIEVTEKLLAEIKANAPIIRVYNKCDENTIPCGKDMYISAKYGINTDKLLAAIEDELLKCRKELLFLIPYGESGKLSELYETATVLSTEYTDLGIEIKTLSGADIAGKFGKYIKKN